MAQLDKSGVGSEQHGKRPVVIIQNNVGNRHSPTVIVAMLTTARKKRHLPTHVHVHKNTQNNLPQSSIVLLEQIRSVDKIRLTEYIGQMDQYTMYQIDEALAISIGLAKPQEKAS